MVSCITRLIPDHHHTQALSIKGRQTQDSLQDKIHTKLSASIVGTIIIQINQTIFLILRRFNKMPKGGLLVKTLMLLLLSIKVVRKAARMNSSMI